MKSQTMSFTVMELPTKRKRTEITVAVKKALCQYKLEHPKCSQDRLVEFIKDTYAVTIGRSTVSDILKHSDKWMAFVVNTSTEQKLTRIVHVKHAELEDALFMWFSSATSHNVAISDEILTIKAKELGEALGISDLVYSRGWLCNFKRRRGISLREKHGEPASSDVTAAASARERMQVLLRSHQNKDIFNFSETGLFYRLEPNKTLACGPVKGTKRCKDRISVGLCANADGSEKLTPVVIHKSKKPRCFHGFNPNTFVDYYANKKAWMTPLVFQEFIEQLERKMRMKKRKIILLVDNSPSHNVTGLELNYVRVEFLPTNTTAEIQPMDAGVIRNFKGHYRRYLMKQYIQDFHEKGKVERINVKDAIYFIRDAWKDVKQSTIANCWRHAGILPGCTNHPCEQSDSVEVENEVACLIREFKSEDPVTAEEYLAWDNAEPTEAMLTTADILSLVSNTENRGDSDSESEGEEDPPKPVTLRQAIEGMETGLRYMEEQGFTAVDVDAIRGLLRRVREHQNSITTYQT
ncbi:tigger transposable element-derived protein 6 [Stegastes partitus]|uniref:Tigger transposable element-derived protein 6 n=1 Tax=Stegastes partitus TaxID=144197 RepID=A0A9Y4NSK1_9TELE|nr:PREDICTED: tigger transposable element-derived protein 6-like [Stegastes partitus]